MLVLKNGGVSPEVSWNIWLSIASAVKESGCVDLVDEGF